MKDEPVSLRVLIAATMTVVIGSLFVGALVGQNRVCGVQCKQADWDTGTNVGSLAEPRCECASVQTGEP